MIPEAEPQSRLRNFLNRYRDIQAIARQAEEKIERFTAARFSIFHFWNPNEVALSGLIADFLNPQGRHGQGPLFLEKFLSLLNRQLKSDDRLSTSALSATEVTTEAATSHIESSQRRIDILAVNSKSRWVLAIENKPWAVDQVDQLPDYQAHLEAKYAYRDKVMIYLSGKGSPPQDSTKINRRWLVVMGYQRGQIEDRRFFLSDWLAEARDCCQVDKVRHILADWAGWVAANFITAEEKGAGHEPDGN